jgi:hypothetical protein
MITRNMRIRKPQRQRQHIDPGNWLFGGAFNYFLIDSYKPRGAAGIPLISRDIGTLRANRAGRPMGRTQRRRFAQAAVPPVFFVTIMTYRQARTATAAAPSMSTANPPNESRLRSIRQSSAGWR